MDRYQNPGTRVSYHEPAWIANAKRVVGSHRTSSWTGCCLVCGRPDPCPEAESAKRLLMYADGRRNRARFT